MIKKYMKISNKIFKISILIDVFYVFFLNLINNKASYLNLFKTYQIF